MRVYLRSPDLRAEYQVAPNEPVELDDDEAIQHIEDGLAVAVGRRASHVGHEPSRAPASALDDLTKRELVEMAEAKGAEVTRADGKDGRPLKSDYVRALRH